MIVLIKIQHPVKLGILFLRCGNVAKRIIKGVCYCQVLVIVISSKTLKYFKLRVKTDHFICSAEINDITFVTSYCYFQYFIYNYKLNCIFHSFHIIY